MRVRTASTRLTRPRRLVVASAVVLLVVPASVTAVAAPPGTPTAAPAGSAVTSSAHQGAMKAYAEARGLYARGHYRDAVKRLEEARVLDPTAKELVYNLALVHEKLGELDEALRYMKTYVGMETDPVERERAEKAVERLEGARKDLAKKAEPVPEPPPAPQQPLVVPSAAPPPPPPAPRRGRLDAWTIGAAGVSVVGLGAGTFFGISALSQSPSDPTTSRGGASVQSLRDDAAGAHNKAIMADIGFGVAIAAGAAAAILYFTRNEPASQVSQAALSPRGLEVSF